MLRERFDIITHLHEEILRFGEEQGIDPKVMMLSPVAFEWLLTVFREDERILGVSPIDTIDWTYYSGSDTLQIIIDESLDDYTIRVL